MSTTEWKLYDFDANWRSFLEAWKDERTQRVLDEDMVDWCEHQAYYEYDHDGTKTKPKWRRDTPLWTLSRTDYWDTRITKTINDDTTREFRCYQEALKRAGLLRSHRTFHTDSDSDSDPDDEDEDNRWMSFFHHKTDLLYHLNSPRSDSIDSFIMIMGKLYLLDAMRKAAQILFPECDIICTEETVLIADEKLIFDLFGYYFETTDGEQYEISSVDLDGLVSDYRADDGSENTPTYDSLTDDTDYTTETECTTESMTDESYSSNDDESSIIHHPSSPSLSPICHQGPS